jgi:hypothetical protein
MRLPRGDLAQINRSKVSQYLLNLRHPHGRHKAVFFASFGFAASDPDSLVLALLRHAAEQNLSRVLETEYGPRYIVECSIRSPDGRDPCIRSVWQDNAAGIPELITAYPVPIDRNPA